MRQAVIIAFGIGSCVGFVVALGFAMVALAAIETKQTKRLEDLAWRIEADKTWDVKNFDKLMSCREQVSTPMCGESGLWVGTEAVDWMYTEHAIDNSLRWARRGFKVRL